MWCEAVQAPNGSHRLRVVLLSLGRCMWVSGVVWRPSEHTMTITPLLFPRCETRCIWVHSVKSGNGFGGAFKIACKFPGVVSLTLPNPFDKVLELASADARVKDLFDFICGDTFVIKLQVWVVVLRSFRDCIGIGCTKEQDTEDGVDQAEATGESEMVHKQ